VSGLVHRDGVLLLGEEDVGILAPSQQDAVPRVGEVGCGENLSPAADREDRRLVGEVGEVGPGESRRAAGDHVEVDVSHPVRAATTSHHRVTEGSERMSWRMTTSSGVPGRRVTRPPASRGAPVTPPAVAGPRRRRAGELRG
jgi:hypothetical protein